MLLPEKKPISVMAEEERKRAEAEKESEKQPDMESCDCSDRKPEVSSEREKEVSSSIAFEDALHNQVYIKRVSLRRRRETNDNISGVPVRRDTSYLQVIIQQRRIFSSISYDKLNRISLFVGIDEGEGFERQS